jgi:pimeloyl-ACP methyl ester carboxylesterase
VRQTSVVATHRPRQRHRALVVTEEGDGPPVILAHGFPESAYSWRHQLHPLAAAGYHAIAPISGYGGERRPVNVVTRVDRRALISSASSTRQDTTKACSSATTEAR